MDLYTKIYSAQHNLRQKLIARRYARAKTELPKVDPTTFSPERILVVLAGLLGDSVMSTPAIAEAKALWPDAHLTVLCMTHNRELLRADPNIDDFYVCNADPFSIRSSRDISELKVWLAAGEFDLAIILLGDQYAHLLAEAGIQVRVGVSGTALEGCLTHTYDIRSPREWGSNERLNAFRALGYSVPPRAAELWIDGLARVSAKEKLGNETNYVVVHPFGSTQRQWLPASKVTALIDGISELGFRTVLIGGKETLATQISSRTIVDTRGLLSLPELLAVIDESKAVVSTDSGPFHIAGALGKTVIGMFRSSRPEHATAYSSGKVEFGSNDKCNATCVWDKCAANECRQMRAIGIDRVLSLLAEDWSGI